MLVINPQFLKPGDFHGGFAMVNGNQLIDRKGTVLGQFDMDGKLLNGFASERAVVETPTGYYHIKPNGLPAYFSKYDAVTPYVGDIAFAKKGEQWELTRKAGQKGDREIKVSFTMAKKNLYQQEFGKNRKQRLQYDNAMMDVKWEKISDGYWKMIGKDGTIISVNTYEEVSQLDENLFRVKLNNLVGISDLEGKVIVEAENEVLRKVSENVIRLEVEGKIRYMAIDSGKFIWE